jgi:hypothetical protein
MCSFRKRQNKQFLRVRSLPSSSADYLTVAVVDFAAVDVVVVVVAAVVDVVVVAVVDFAAVDVDVVVADAAVIAVVSVADLFANDV